MRRGPSTSGTVVPVQAAIRQRWIPLIVAVLGIAAVGRGASAQGGSTTGTITGRVTEAGSTSPLGSASIRVTGTQIGAQSGSDGRFTIRGIRPGTVDLQVTRIGYSAKHVSVTVGAGATVTSDFALTQAPFSLAAVVTTVTGVQSKAEISNTVASIDVTTKIAEAPITTTGELISGRAAGVQVISSGAVGSGSRIRIRGQSSLSLSNDPIVYVDGVRVDAKTGDSGIGTGGTTASAFDNINPEEIESIDVIKGPAAATLYGTQAANGVIVVTTKRGRAGSPHYTVWTENGTLSDPHKGSYPDLWVSFDRRTGLKTCTLVQQASGSCIIDSTYHNNVLNEPDLTPLHTGIRSQYGIQASGGADRLQFFISGDQEHTQGPYKMPDREISRLMTERASTIGADQIYPNAEKKVSLRTNLNTQLTPKVSLAVSVGYVDNDNRQPQNEDNSDGLMVAAIGGSARTDLKDPRGLPLLGYRSFPIGDIFAQVTTQNINRFINGVNAQYLPLPWLTTRANVGYDYSARNATFLQQLNQGPFNEQARTGSVQNNRAETAIYTVDLGGTATMSAHHGFGLKTSGGMQYFRSWFSSSTGTGLGMPPGATTTSAGSTRTATQSTTESINLGAYGEEVVSYDDRVFLTGGLRYDGNSAFGTGFSGVYYPKIGASWLLSDERFFPRIDAINSFRVRATYGSSGVQPGALNALRYYQTANANISGTEQSGVTLTALGNTKLKPEYSGEFEAGFDASAFSNRTSIELTYYDKKTKDALINAPTAPSVGGAISSLLENIGSTRNQGLELTLNQKLVDRRQLGFDVQLTGSTTKNRIITLGEGVTPIFTGNRSTQYNAPGYPLFGLWGKTYSYSDANNDGIIVASEMKFSDTAVFIGPTAPTHEFALSPRLELLSRKLAISAQFDHKDGMTKFYNTLRHRCQGGASCEGLWDPHASLADQAAAVADNLSSSVYTGYFFNGEFTRLRELSVAYQLPDALANKVHSSRASIIGTGRNLHVWTAYPGIDPEATVGNTDTRGNEEYFSTPPLRYFTLRLNLNF
jgi:TonB-linked SusC/RagA family outer membrane protein